MLLTWQNDPPFMAVANPKDTFFILLQITINKSWQTTIDALSQKTINKSWRQTIHGSFQKTINTLSQKTINKYLQKTIKSNNTYLLYFHHGSFFMTHIYDIFTIAVFLNAYIIRITHIYDTFTMAVFL